MTDIPVALLEAVHRRFNDGEHERTVLDGLDLQVDAGELVAIVGASGSGKTTLLNVIGALDASFVGRVSVFGESVGKLDDDARTDLRNRLIGFVFQSYHLFEHLSVLENVEVPIWLNGGIDEATAEQRARAALERVGLLDRATGSVGPLSGGERQRVAIARAVVHEPRLILADEPTGNLDEVTGRDIYGLFDGIRKRTEDGGCAVVIVTHDRNLADRADRVLRLVDGRLETES